MEPIADRIMKEIKQAALLYHRLVLVVGPAGTGKTTALRYLQDRNGAPFVNVNLELSRRMLDLTRHQRILRVPRLLQEIADRGGEEMVLLDNLEVLFDVGLRQDPLRLLQGLSRNRIVVAAWNGTNVGGFLTYAAPGHPEYKSYPIRDFLVASVEEAG